MYRNKRIYSIRYTDVDAYDCLKLSSLLSFLEESAACSADELGFGYNQLTVKNMGFIVVNWYIELKRPIKLSDCIEVHTWPIKPKFLIFLRDFELFCNSEKVGVATSRWCMIDTDNYKTLPVSAFFKDGSFDDYNTQRSTEFSLWKIPKIDNGWKVYSKRVMYSDYDHYFHVNNTKYADYLLDVFAVDELKGKFVRTAQITYCKQCKEGEILDFVRSDLDGHSLIEGNVGDELRVQLKVQFGEI